MSYLHGLEELANVYKRVKQLILLAEEIDPEFRSNIAVVKEMRDALDHLMRYHFEQLAEAKREQSESYLLAQIEKARGHVFRAGYDAIDGIVVSYRIRLSKALEGVSNEAIADIYPAYYKCYGELNQLCSKIVQHRDLKDIGDHTLDNLAAYASEAEKLGKHCQEGLELVPLMIQFDKKKIWNVFFEKVGLALIVAVVGGLTVSIFNNFVFGQRSVKSNAVSNSTTANPAKASPASAAAKATNQNLRVK